MTTCVCGTFQREESSREAAWPTWNIELDWYRWAEFLKNYEFRDAM